MSTIISGQKNKNKEQEARILASQVNWLKKPGTIMLLIEMALFPFSSTAELLGWSQTKLSRGQIQKILRQALGWGWIGNLQYYQNNSAELSGLCSASPEGLNRLPAIPLEEKLINELLEKITRNPRLARSNRANRRYYLTHQGARILARLVELNQPEKRRDNNWRVGFSQRFGFIQAELPLYLRRLNGSILTRPFIFRLVASLTGGPDATDCPVLNWQERMALINPAGYQLGIDGLALINQITNYEQNVSSTITGLAGEKVCPSSVMALVVVADPENLAGSWVGVYLRQLLPLLAPGNLNLPFYQPIVWATASDLINKLGQLDNIVGFELEQNPPGISHARKADETCPQIANFRMPQNSLADKIKAAARLDLADCFLNKPANEKREVLVEADSSKIRLIVITRSEARAELWRLTIRQVCQKLELALPLHTIFTLTELEKTGKEEFRARIGLPPRLESADYQCKTTCNPPANKLVAGLKYYLKNDSELNPARAIQNYSQQPEYIQNYGAGAGLLIWLLSSILRRKLLYHLFVFGMSDLTGLRRISGINFGEIKKLTGQLEQWGLIAKLWPRDKTRLRAKGSRILPSAPPLNMGVEQVVTNFRRQKLGRLGPLSAAAYQAGTSTVYSYEPIEVRQSRHYYFITEAGLMVLHWLEGFGITFDPTFRRERQVNSNRALKLTSGELQLGICNADTGQIQLVKGGVDIGFCWPNQTIQHNSAVKNFFLAWPSRHYFSVLGSAAKYSNRKNPETLMEIPDLSAPELNLEVWETEPYCHRFYIPPETLWAGGNWAKPSKETADYPGQLLPDGYGEISLVDQTGKKSWLRFYLEYESNLLNKSRYPAKAAAYLRQLWSNWLVASFKRDAPAPVSQPTVLFLVTTTEQTETSFARLFSLVSLGCIGRLWWFSSFEGISPGGQTRPINQQILREYLVYHYWRGKQFQQEIGEVPGETIAEDSGWLKTSLGQDWKELVGEKFIWQIQNLAKLNIPKVLGGPELGLEIFSTNETLLTKQSPVGQVWRPVYLPWSKGYKVKGRMAPTALIELLSN